MSELDPSVLRGIRSGDRSALEALVRHYAAPVYRYLVRLCGDATLAEDLAQEVAVQMWRGLPGRSFPNTRALNAWVYTVAANQFRMHHRRKRAGEVPLESQLDLAAGEAFDPARAAERDDTARLVRQAVQQLPEAERQALLLKAFGDLRYQDIAAMTGEPVGTVKWRISRAYERLRKMLLPEMGPAMGNPMTGKMEEGHESLRSTADVPGRRDEPAGSLAHAASSPAVPRLFGTNGR
jgi:RNA polymerase sigma-70 factor (ECF subfamily)